MNRSLVEVSHPKLGETPPMVTPLRQIQMEQTTQTSPKWKSVEDMGKGREITEDIGVNLPTLKKYRSFKSASSEESERLDFKSE